MPRIIFKCPYLKSGAAQAAHRKSYVRYVATREGVEYVPPGKARLPAKEKQRGMVEQLLEDDYDHIAKRENYLQYIAQRPRAQRIGSHGLFTGTDEPLVLSQVAEAVAHHPGSVWLPIISLRREDAARLGYDGAEQWRALLSSCGADMAQAMKIPFTSFRWYAAYHDEGTHPHVHMVCYSADPGKG